MSTESYSHWTTGRASGLAVSSHPLTEAERLLVVRRPDYLPVQQAIETFLSQLEQYTPDALTDNIELVDTAPTAEGTAANLRKHHLNNSDGLVLFGGDGTNSAGLQAAHELEFNGNTLLYATGNACDQAHMLYRRTHIRQPLAALFTSRIAQLHLLETTATLPNGTTIQRYASAYTSNGTATTAVVENENNDIFRQKLAGKSELHKLTIETAMLWDEISRSSYMTIEDNDGRRDITDIVMPNGSIMAKLLHFGGVQFLEPGYGVMEVSHLSHASVGWHILRAGLGRFKHYTSEDKPYEFRLTVKGEEGIIRGQVDGEPYYDPDGTSYRMQVSERPLNIITNKS